MTTPRRTGATMYVLAAIGLVALLTMLFSGILDQQRNPNQVVNTRISNDGATSISLKRNRMGHYVVSGTINGYPAEFLLDTGATAVSVSTDVARHAGLRRGASITASTANGITTAYATRIAEISIGGIQQHDIAASIAPNLPDDQVLLGMSFLKRLDFSQRGDTLVLKIPGHPEPAVPRDRD